MDAVTSPTRNGLSPDIWREVAEHLPLLAWIVDADGRLQWANARWREFAGTDPADVAERWLPLLLPGEGPSVAADLAATLAAGQAWGGPVTLGAQDGRTIRCDARLQPVAAGKHGLRYAIGTATELPDSPPGVGESEAEQALARSEERLRIATEHAEVGFWDVDEANGRLTWPPLVKRLFGLPPDVEVTMDDFYAGLHPEDFDAVATAYAAAADPARRALYDVEYRTVGREDGVVRWVAAKGRGLFSDDGRCLRVVGTVVDISDRRAAEEALRDSEARYRTLFESMEQGFCIVQVAFEGDRATDHLFTEINPAFIRQSGLSGDVIGKSVRDVIPDLEPSWTERYGRIARTGVHERFVEQAAALGRWFEVYAFPIGRPDLHQVAILFTDVTERVERERSLEQSESELRLRLNAIPQMVWSTLPDGYHDFYNDRWYEFTGAPAGTTDGEGWNGMFHPDDQPLAWQRWAHSLATGEPYEIEYRLRHHSGAYRWVLGRALPVHDESGTIVRWMGTCTDIDDRVEADRALQASEARLRAILEAVPVGLMFANAEGRLTGSNHQIAEFLGHDLKASSRIADYGTDYVAFHADGRKVASEEYPLARALGGEDRPELECQVQRGDGVLRWLRYVAAPILSPEGEITGGVVASIDIDRERRLTLGLEREVEKVVAEREAAQEALRQSQKLEAMGQLTGGVAHDFNNLLTPIIGSLDLLQRKQVLDERTSRLMEGALASAERARVLVQRLLAFARRQPLQPQPIDVARIVSEMSELIDSTSGPRVRVRSEIPAGIPPALADGNQLEMALLNLSVNARDAMPDGGTLSITVRCEPGGSGRRLGLGERAHVVIGVSDTGVGMDEETRRRAIEPFFSTKGIGKGTGLGLSMVHGLAAQLGGALDIRSAPGIGTTIELWLPVADGKVAAGPAEAAESERHGAGIVLLVDDEEYVRASTAGMLAELGYRVIEAASGEDALERVRDGTRPNLLVTDQLMPGLSGTDLAVQLREAMPDLPVLVVSGYADLDSLSPAFPHLSKPFRQAELAAALERTLAD
ncbi:PAS domain S-box protein [Sphingomonas astaxanthinifaciens]|nr:PAS domain S-box protein [Sphingomonas astaxanthinifaciens]